MSEHSEQVAVFTWARAMSRRYPALRNLFAIPNAGKRSIGAANYMKAEGLESGVPDMFLAQSRIMCCHHGLFIEQKILGGKTSVTQEDWHARLRKAGYRVEICYTADEAIATIKNYLGIEDELSGNSG